MVSALLARPGFDSLGGSERHLQRAAKLNGEIMARPKVDRREEQLKALVLSLRNMSVYYENLAKTTDNVVHYRLEGKADAYALAAEWLEDALAVK